MQSGGPGNPKRKDAPDPVGPQGASMDARAAPAAPT